MPKVFLNGTTPVNGNYPGESFADVSALLTHFKTTLQSAGWTTTLDDIANGVLEIQGSDNGHNCKVRIAASVVSGSILELSFRGDKNGDGLVLSPDTVKATVTVNDGKLYIAANERAFVAMVYEDGGVSMPVYCGFPERKNPNDANAWIVGDLSYRMSNKYIASSQEGVDWEEFKNFFYTSSEATNLSTSSQGCYDGTLDRYTTFIFGLTTSQNVSQSAYYAWNGGVDGETGNPIMGDFYLKQGVDQGSYSHPITQKAYPANYLGKLDFAKVGLLSLQGGRQAFDTIDICGTNYKFTIISGSDTYQGFVIMEEVV